MSGNCEKNKVEILVEEYQRLHESLKEAQVTKQQLLSQQNENETVQKELSILESDATLYKLVGPVLVKQPVEEAKSTVKKRLAYINTEIERCESACKDLASKIETRGQELQVFQDQIFAARQQSSAAARS